MMMTDHRPLLPPVLSSAVFRLLVTKLTLILAFNFYTYFNPHYSCHQSHYPFLFLLSRFSAWDLSLFYYQLLPIIGRFVSAHLGVLTLYDIWQ